MEAPETILINAKRLCVSRELKRVKEKEDLNRAEDLAGLIVLEYRTLTKG